MPATGRGIEMRRTGLAQAWRLGHNARRARMWSWCYGPGPAGGRGLAADAVGDRGPGHRAQGGQSDGAADYLAGIEQAGGQPGVMVAGAGDHLAGDHGDPWPTRASSSP